MAVLSLFDSLYCQEDSLELEEERTGPVPPVLDELAAVAEEEWANVLCFLAAKEEETRPELPVDCGGEDTYLLSARREAVEWVARTAARRAFSVLTAMLAVNYLDRCFLPSAAAGGLRLQKDKPWMGRLAAVACLSLAAKVEETSVPLLLDLQAAATPEPEENKYVFEAKTIRRMELLVLSTLSWRMNPVTPLSFVHHLLLRLYPKYKNAISTTTAARIRELVGGCETILLSVIADWRWVRYPASAWAAAALLHAADGGGGTAAASSDFYETHRLVAFLDVPKEKVEECYQLIMESMVHDGGITGQKRKHWTSSLSHCHTWPASPDGVVGSCFSCESSSSGGDSWTICPSSVSSSPEIRPSKRPSSTANKTNGDEGIVEEGVLFAFVPM
ncbi:cyclin-D3-2-like [Musa acuminata AAA Group]|uniref:cyclin-D3-2-like n=1 Tax=Musa acuminata AAA Group TaxID=214697 RepID=UPI0031E3749F